MLIDGTLGSRCTSDYQCAGHLACKNHQCKDVCGSANCATNAKCRAVNHVAICSCPEDFDGQPLTECTRQEPCTYNVDCAKNRACKEGKCVNPCNQCKNKSKCTIEGHVATCNDENVVSLPRAV